MSNIPYRQGADAVVTDSIDNIFEFDLEDIELKGYKHHPHIRGKISV